MNDRDARDRGVGLGGIFLGAWLVLWGLLLLARNAGWVQFHVSWQTHHLWPLILIIVGCSFIRIRGIMGRVIGIPLAILLAGAAVLMMAGTRSSLMKSSQTFSIPKEPKVTAAVVSIATGGGRVELSAGSDVLLEGRVDSEFLNLLRSSSAEGVLQSVTLETELRWPRLKGAAWNDMNLHLLAHFPMDVHLATGAAQLYLDFSEIALKTLVLEAGAADVHLTLGKETTLTKVRIRAGAASVHVEVPETVGVEVKVDAPLSNQVFPGFRRVGKDEYRTAGFESSPKKIIIRFEGGLSHLEIRRISAGSTREG